MIKIEERTGTTDTATQISSKPDSDNELNKDRDTILGIERKLERDESDGRDTSLGRLAVARRYSNYASSMVRKTGGSLLELKSLTDRNNMAPLRGAGRDSLMID